MNEYKNLDLKAFEYQQDGDVGTFKVRVQSAPKYEGSGEAIRVTLPADLDSRLRALEKRLLGAEEIVELGRDLGAALFPDGVRTLLETNLALVQEKGDRLRIRLMLDDFPLADIPWEYAYLPQPGIDGFLALDGRMSLVRYETAAGLLGHLTPTGPGPLRIAILLADPNTPEYPPLKLDEEQTKIEGALAKVSQLLPTSFPNATIDELEDACDSHILHFAGHGEFKTEMGTAFATEHGKGFLVLLDEFQNPFHYSVEKLRVILTGKQVRLAVLGACETGRRDHVNVWSGIAPALARVGIPAVVGMQYTIDDKNAIRFSWRFYRALADRKPVDEAVNLGRQAVFNRCPEDERDWGVPVLYLRTDAAEDGRLFFDEPTVSTGQPTTTLTGEVVVSPTAMIAGTAAPGGAVSVLPAVLLCPKPGCGTPVSGNYCHICATQVRCLRCGAPLPADAKVCPRCEYPVLQ